MRPNLSEEVVNDVERLVDELSVVDPEHLGFEQQLGILIANIPECGERELRGVSDRDEPPLHRKYS